MLECKPSAIYVRRVLGVMGAYIVAIAAVFLAFTAKVVPGPLAVPVALLPIIPAAFFPFVIHNQLKFMDELQRKIRFEAMGFALASGCVLSLSYGFLQQFAGAPDANWVWVLPLFGALLIVGILIGRWRYR